MDTSIQQFDVFIKNNSLLTHYFYEQKWNNGELTLEELQEYAKQYYHLAKSVPGVVSRVRDRAIEKGSPLVAQIEHNIEEETEHIALWERFAKSLGVPKAELDAHEPHAKVQEAIRTLQALADESFESGVAAMYAMELEIPAIAQSKKDGLCTHYNLDSEDAHIYFDEHLNEEAHFGVWRQVAIEPESAEKAIKASLQAQHLVLDGVCDACGIEQEMACGC